MFETAFHPIAGVKVGCGGVKLPNCPGTVYSVNDGISRISFWVTALLNNGVNQPMPFDFKVKAGSNCYTTSVFEGVCDPVFLNPDSPTPWESRGLLVQVSGLLAEQYELWAAITVQAGSQLEYGIRIEAMFDRVAGPQGVVLGRGTTQTFSAL